MKPTTKYVKSDGINIAYQVIGDGPVDMVYVSGWVSNIDMMWENIRMTRFLLRLSKLARLILFDKRGTGLSDRIVEHSTVEERMDDIRAVMDVVKSERAVLFGHSEGGTVSALFSATYPKRTQALITFGVYAKREYSKDYPWAHTNEERQEFYNQIENGWGSDEMKLESLVPSLAGDKEFMDWLASYLRSGASPSAALALAKMNTKIDVIDILETIQVPALIMHRTGDIDVNIDEGLYFSQRIKNSIFIELSGNDHLFWIGDTDSVINNITDFLTGTKTIKSYDSSLYTVLFTDIVDSTKYLAECGDKKWMLIMAKHNQIVRSSLNKYQGMEVKNTGDGFLNAFDTPIRAVRCALYIRKEMSKLNIEIRVGIHAGTCEVIGVDDIGGITVHIASRILNEAKPSEILFSQTVKNLLSGSGIDFSDSRNSTLKGIQEKIILYSV